MKNLLLTTLIIIVWPVLHFAQTTCETAGGIVLEQIPFDYPDSNENLNLSLNFFYDSAIPESEFETTDIEFIEAGINAYDFGVTFSICSQQMECVECYESSSTVFTEAQYCTNGALNVMITKNQLSGPGAAQIGGKHSYAPYTGEYQLMTILHEIGHMLGLVHTFSGNGNGLPNNEGIRENVTRDLSSNNYNAESSGDFCYDTPADPFGFMGYYQGECGESLECIYTDQEDCITDDFGEIYADTPSPHHNEQFHLANNLLSYYNNNGGECSELTTSQKQRISWTVANYHSNAIANTFFDFSKVIDGEGSWDCQGGRLYILEDLIIEDELQVFNGIVEIAPGVTIFAENGSTIEFDDVDINLMTESNPLCGMIGGGELWKGFKLNGGYIHMYNTRIDGAVLPFDVSEGSILALQNVELKNLNLHVIKVDGNSLITINTLLVDGTGADEEVGSHNHILIENNGMFNAFTKMSILGKANADTGIRAINSPLTFSQDCSFENLSTGIYMNGHHLSVNRVTFTNCKKTAIDANGLQILHVKNTKFINCAISDNDNFGAITTSECPNYEIRNNEFSFCDRGGIFINGTGMGDEIRNNIFKQCTRGGIRIRNTELNMNPICNQFVEHHNIDIDGGSGIKPLIGIPIIQGNASAGNKFSQENVSNFDISAIHSVYHFFNSLNEKPIEFNLDDDPKESFIQTVCAFGLEEVTTPGPVGGGSSIPNNPPDEGLVPGYDDDIVTLVDTDGDGNPNVFDSDDDNDGIPDDNDPDDDNDGIKDYNDDDWCPPGTLCGDPNDDPVINEWDILLMEYENEIDLLENQLNEMLLSYNQSLMSNLSQIQNITYANSKTLILDASPFITIDMMDYLIGLGVFSNENHLVFVLNKNPELLRSSTYIDKLESLGHISRTNRNRVKPDFNNNEHSYIVNEICDNSRKHRILNLKKANRYLLFGESFELFRVIEREVSETKENQEIDFSEPNDFTLSPNPVNDHLLIYSEQDIQLHIRVFNQNGQIQISGKFSTNEKINCQDLLAGVYYCEINSPNSNQILKFIKI